MPQKKHQNKKITISLNGQNCTIKKGRPHSVTELLEQEGYTDKTVAIAINGHFIPKTTYSEHILKEGDLVDVVAPMQGG